MYLDVLLQCISMYCCVSMYCCEVQTCNYISIYYCEVLYLQLPDSEYFNSQSMALIMIMSSGTRVLSKSPS